MLILKKGRDYNISACLQAVGLIPMIKKIAFATDLGVLGPYVLCHALEIAKQFPDAEYRDTWVWFQSGLNTDGAHNPVTARALQAGDILKVSLPGSGQHERLFFIHGDGPVRFAFKTTLLN